MKKIILFVALATLAFSMSANSIRYFTYSQAERAIRHLDAQTELMIYCGYEDEIETYVLVNEVWAERINSQYYEIWLYGFDAYTGDEIYMPIDLGCIWLYNRTGTRMYSAATTLRFRNSRPLPTFLWAMPPYNPFQRRFHAPGFLYTYHYDIHRPGWHHPHTGHNPYNYPPYYMRHRTDPVPVHHEPYTPGMGYPRTMTPDGHGYLGNTRGSNPTTTVDNPNNMATSSTASTRRTTGNTANPNTIQLRTPASSQTGTSTNSNSRQTTSTRSGSSSNTTGTSSRGSSTQSSGSTTRSSGTTSRSTGTSTGTTSRSSNSTSTSTPSRSTSNSSNTATRGSDNRSTSNSTSRSTTGSTSTRSTTSSSSSNTTSRQSSTTTSSTRSSSNNTVTRSSSAANRH